MSQLGTLHRHRKLGVANAIPAAVDALTGELLVNIADGRVYTRAGDDIADVGIDRPYVSRAAAVAATVPAVQQRLSLISGGMILRYIRDASGTALTTTDGADWSPDGPEVYPDHWAENTTPGTTDMTTAFQAAADFAAIVYGRPTIYRISDTIVFNEKVASGYQQAGFHGNASYLTIIQQADETKDTFSFIRSDQDANFIFSPSFRDFRVVYSMAAGNTSDCAAIRARRGLNGQFVNIHVYGPQWAFAMENTSQCRFEFCYFQGAFLRESKGMFLWTHNPYNNDFNCFGNFVSNCETMGSNVDIACVHKMEAVDGLYIVNSHFNNYKKCYVIGADGTGGKYKCVSLYVANTYHDANGDKEQDIFFTGMTGSADSYIIRSITFSGGTFRAHEGTAKVLSFDAAAQLAGLEAVDHVVFTGVHFWNYKNCFIETIVNGTFDEVAKITNWAITGNTFMCAFDATNPGLRIAGQGFTIDGNVFSGGFTDLTHPPIFISIACDRMTIGDSNCFNCTRTTNVVVSASATNIFMLRYASYANDAAAATAGVPVHGLYKDTSGNIKWRQT